MIENWKIFNIRVLLEIKIDLNNIKIDSFWDGANKNISDKIKEESFIFVVDISVTFKVNKIASNDLDIIIDENTAVHIINIKISNI